MANIFKSEIKRIMEEAREKLPIPNEQLLDDGAIYYMNGNDSTPSDFFGNDRLCEFYMFHKSKIGYIKVNINRDDTIDVYIYKDGDFEPTIHYEDKLDGCIEAEEFALIMNEIADNKKLYDQPIDNLEWIDTAYALEWGEEYREDDEDDYDEDDYDEDEDDYDEDDYDE